MDAEVRPSWWSVIALAAVGQAVAALAFETDGTVSVSRSFMPVVIGVAQTIFGVLIGPFLLAFIGGWLDGEADPAEIRQAVVWGYAPVAIAGLCWIPVQMIYRGRVSAPDTEMPLFMLPLMLAVIAGAAWSVVAQVVMLAEVQRFSVWKAIASIVVVLIPTLLLGHF